MQSLPRWSVLLLLPIGLLAGCTSLVPPPQAVLAGTWTLATATQGLLGPTTLVFDVRGNLQQISIKAAGNVDLVRNNPLSNTTVDGDQVSLDVNILLIGTLHFSGTLNPDMTVVTGQLTTDLNFLVANVIIDNGAATLTKGQ